MTEKKEKKNICQSCKDKDAKNLKPYYLGSPTVLRVWCMKCFLKHEKEQFQANHYERHGDD